MKQKNAAVFPGWLALYTMSSHEQAHKTIHPDFFLSPLEDCFNDVKLRIYLNCLYKYPAVLCSLRT